MINQHFSYYGLITFACIVILIHYPDLVATQAERLEVEEPRLEGEDRHIGHAKHGIRERRVRVRYSTSYHVPPELLRRKGGLNLVAKERLIAANSSVLLSDSLRHLLVATVSNHSNLSYLNNLAICEGLLVNAVTKLTSLNETLSAHYFACPLHLSDEAGNLDEEDEQTYCCGQAPRQTCCDKENFYRINGRPVTPSAVVIAVSATSGLTLLGLVVGLLFCVKLRAQRKSSIKKAGSTRDPALKPLIISEEPAMKLQSVVFTASQQVPVESKSQTH